MYNTEIKHLVIDSSNDGCSVFFLNSDHTMGHVKLSLLKHGVHVVDKQLKAKLLCSLDGVSGFAGEFSYRCRYSPHEIESIMIEVQRTTPTKLPFPGIVNIRWCLPSSIDVRHVASMDTDDSRTYQIPFGKVIH